MEWAVTVPLNGTVTAHSIDRYRPKELGCPTWASAGPRGIIAVPTCLNLSCGAMVVLPGNGKAVPVGHSLPHWYNPTQVWTEDGVAIDTE